MSRHLFKYLDLSHNNFFGKLSSLDLGMFINLTPLKLSRNGLLGDQFPVSPRNCHLLETLVSL